MLDITYFGHSFDGIVMRVLVVTCFIIVNLVASIWVAIRQGKFKAKKLPKFMGEWVMSILALSMTEMVIFTTTDSALISGVFVGLRDVMVLSVLVCYTKKMLESFSELGWDVNISGLVDFLSKSK